MDVEKTAEQQKLIAEKLSNLSEEFLNARKTYLRTLGRVHFAWVLVCIGMFLYGLIIGKNL